MFDRLAEFINRHEELSSLINDPDIIADQTRWQALMKEYSTVTPIAEKYCEYCDAKKAVEEAIEMLDDNVPGSEKIDIKQAVENYNDAIYYLALCNYELRNYDVVITLLKDIDDKRARILYGSALFDTANYDDEYEYAWQQFKFIDGDVEYASAPKAKYEEKIYTVAVLLLSQLYRQGLGEKHTKSNLEKSVNLLNFVKSYLTNEGMLELVDEELRHYQKKMLGGYKYV